MIFFSLPFLYYNEESLYSSVCLVGQKVTHMQRYEGDITFLLAKPLSHVNCIHDNLQEKI